MNTRDILRWLAAIGFIGAGINHFVMPKVYRRIVPPGFGDPAAMVALSGAAEIAGGVGLLIPRLRRPAGWGLITLLIAVFPANVYMAVSPGGGGTHLPRWVLWARLPFQAVFMGWVWFVAMGRGRRS